MNQRSVVFGLVSAPCLYLRENFFRGVTNNISQYKRWTADCGLRTMDCRLGLKHGLDLKHGLRTRWEKTMLIDSR